MTPGDMKPTGVSLSQPPMLPPKLSGPQASLGGMIGQTNTPSAQGGATSEDTMKKAILIEQLLQSLAGDLPDFRPIAEQIVMVLRQGVVRSLQSIAGGGPPPGAPMGAGQGPPTGGPPGAPPA